MPEIPLISVIMPVFNAQEFVLEAAKSILDQTHAHLELIIVDDGCTDTTLEKISSLADERIIILKNDSNSGLAASLNRAIKECRGEYIARMDADDISSRDRFQTQLDFFNQRPEISVVGTGMQYFNYSSFRNFFPEEHEECKGKLLFNVCFGHPSVMFRKTVFDSSDNFYEPSLRQYSEDYELWVRLVDKFQFANIPLVKLKYRTFPPAIKDNAENKRRDNSAMVRQQMLNKAGIHPTVAESGLHKVLSDLTVGINADTFRKVLAWAEKIHTTNNNSRYFDQSALSKILGEQVYVLLYNNPQISVKLREMRNFSFFRNYKVPFYLYMKNSVKRLLTRST